MAVGVDVPEACVGVPDACVGVPDTDKRQTDGVAVLDGVLVPVPEAPLDREAVRVAVGVKVDEAV